MINDPHRFAGRFGILRNRVCRPRRGFTLVEVLVALAIVAALAVLLVAVVLRMRDKADKAAVIHNLAQLQLANTAYATDHQGKFVPYLVNDVDGKRAAYWYQDTDFLTYLRGEQSDASGNPSKSVPLSALDPKVVRAKLAFYSSMAGSYGLNNTGLPAAGGVAFAAPSHNLNNVVNPGMSMAFATATDVRVVYDARFNWFNRGMKEGKTSDGSIAYRHGGKAIVVYFDGHVGEMTRADMEAIDKTRGGTNSEFWRPAPK